MVVFEAAEGSRAMHFWEIPNQARDIRERANALMDEREIAPTPTNYVLWFFYALGQNVELIAALDAAVREGRGNDAALAKELHDTFCDTGTKVEVDATALHLEEELRKLASVLLRRAADGRSRRG